jgi:hypothetical protein
MRKVDKIEGMVIWTYVNLLHEAKSLCRQNIVSASQEIPCNCLEPLSSLQCVQEPAIDWSKPDEYNSQPPILFLEDPF